LRTKKIHRAIDAVLGVDLFAELGAAGAHRRIVNRLVDRGGKPLGGQFPQRMPWIPA
jgi:hypothetical protein